MDRRRFLIHRRSLELGIDMEDRSSSEEEMFTDPERDSSDSESERDMEKAKGEEVDRIDCEGVRTVTMHKHSSNLLKGFQEQRERNEFMDLPLKVGTPNGSESMYVHGCLLAGCSPFIQGFCRNCEKSEVDLSCWSKETVTYLVDWLYKGMLKIEPSNCYDLLELSDYLCLQEVSMECVHYICHNLNFENCSDAYQVSSGYQIPQFKKMVRKYILNNFCQLMKENCLHQIQKDDFLSLASDDYLIIFDKCGFPIELQEEELELFDMMCIHVKQNETYDMWPETLEKVLRYGFMNKADISKMISSANDWLQNCKEKDKCIEMLENILKQKESNSLLNPLWTTPRKGIEAIKIKWTECFASTRFFHDESQNPEDFNDVSSITESLKADKKPVFIYVTGMKMYTRMWENKLVIGGIEVAYNVGLKVLHGGRNYPEGQVHEFTLLPGERIVSIMPKTGWLVDRLEFGTNFGRKLGPYGGDGGGDRIIEPPSYKAYLAGIKGKVTISTGLQVVRHVSFAWAYLKRTNHMCN